MAKQGEEERAIVEEPATEAETLAEAQPKSYSQEELDALLATREEVATETARKAEFDRLNPMMSQQGAELKRLREQQVQPSSSDDTLLEVMLQDRKSRATELGESDPMITRLEQELAERKRKQVQTSQIRWQEQVTQQNREKFDQRIKEAGLNPNDERLDDFHDSFEDAQEDGRFGKVERKLDRILSKVKPSEPKGKESEEERIERLAEEKARKRMEEQGLLTTETGGPSASSPSKKDAYAKFVAGDITAEQAKKAGIIFE